MANFNKVILIGNLTRDPELRYTPKGTAIAKIGLAINRTWKTETGETKEEVTFVDVDAFGRQAETLGQYMKKGRPIMIEGRLKLDTWDDKQTNQKRSRLGVVMETFQFLDFNKSAEGGGAPFPSKSPQPQSAGSGSETSPPDAAASPEEDDVPF
ncbi:MAG: single-stranded DNA-binding protein [Verrucomicrobiota bacterium]